MLINYKKRNKNKFCIYLLDIQHYLFSLRCKMLYMYNIVGHLNTTVIQKKPRV